MGRSTVTVTVTGNHGCNRAAQPGEELGEPCRRPGCVDCRAREMVQALEAGGNDVEVATHTHWPDDPEHAVTDDLKTGKRQSGSFTR